ncbi:hypothetical protein [Seleniivibrio woodruffii]
MDFHYGFSDVIDCFVTLFLAETHTRLHEPRRGEVNFHIRTAK